MKWLRVCERQTLSTERPVQFSLSLGKIVVLFFSLRFKSTQRIDCLWSQPDMSHYRYPAYRKKRNRFGHL